MKFILILDNDNSSKITTNCTFINMLYECYYVHDDYTLDTKILSILAAEPYQQVILFGQNNTCKRTLEIADKFGYSFILVDPPELLLPKICWNIDAPGLIFSDNKKITESNISDYYKVVFAESVKANKELIENYVNNMR